MDDPIWTEKELTQRAHRRLAILRYAEEVSGSTADTCGYYAIGRTCCRHRLNTHPSARAEF